MGEWTQFSSLYFLFQDITSRKRAKPGTGPLRAPPVLTLTLSKVAAELSKSVIEPVYARYAEQVLEPNYEEKKAAAASAMEKQHLAVKGVGGGGGSSSSSKSGGKQQAGGGTTSNKMNPMVVVTAGGGTYGYTGRSGARSHHSLNDLNAKDVGSYSSESESAAKSREISNLSKTYSQVRGRGG